MMRHRSSWRLLPSFHPLGQGIGVVGGVSFQVLMSGCGAPSNPDLEVLDNTWALYGTELVQDGCDLGSMSVMDAKYTLETEVSGDRMFVYSGPLTTTSTYPGRVYCETQGSALECLPFLLPNPPRGAHLNSFRWQLNARLSGTLSGSERVFDGLLELYGVCMDGTSTCAEGDPEPNPALPCRSTLRMHAERPTYEEQGGCLEPGQGSQPSGQPAYITVINESGRDFEFGWIDPSGQRQNYWDIYRTSDPMTVYTELGMVFVVSKEWSGPEDCLGAWTVDALEEYFVVRRF